MPVTADSWIAPDGTRLGFKLWSPSRQPRATILAMHGLSCREDDFVPLAEAMVARDIEVGAWNLRGQGLDPVIGRRGNWLEVGGMLEDLASFGRRIRPGGQPVYLCGESMGALLALQAAISEPWSTELSGLLLFSPVVGLAQKNPPWIQPMLSGISNVFPGLRLKTGWFVHGKGSSPQLTRIPERQQAVETAPHRLDATTISFLIHMGALIEAALPAADQLRVPVAVFSAGQDLFVRPEQVREFFSRVRSPDKTHFHYPESYHQLMFDLDAREVLSDAVGWVESHLAPE